MRKDKAVYMAGLDRTGRRNTHRYLNALRTEDDVLRHVEMGLTQRVLSTFRCSQYSAPATTHSDSGPAGNSCSRTPNNTSSPAATTTP